MMKDISIKSFFADKMQHKNIEIILVNIIIQQYIFRTTLPVFKYLFIALFPLVFLYIIYSNRNKIIKSIRDTIGQLKLVIILITIFFIAFVFSGIFYEIIFVDLINSIVLIVLFYLLIVLLENKTQLNYFIHVFIHLVFVSALFVIISQWTSLFGLTQDQADASEVIDRNFALLPSFFSLFGIFYLYSKKHLSGMLNLSYTVLLVLFTLHIFLSGSRRGLVLISIIAILVVIIHIISLISANFYIRRISKASRFYLLSLIIVSGIFYVFIFHTSCSFKNRTLEYLGSENIRDTKRKITINILGYITIFNDEIRFSDLNKKIWSHSLDPKDPDCGWGFKYGKPIYSLKGNNVELVPRGSIGCLIDSSAFKPENVRGIGTQIASLKNNNSEIYQATIYCYVSEDFDGRFVRLAVDMKNIKEGRIRKKALRSYNLKKKGVWQKLHIKIYYLKGDVPVKYIVYRYDDKLEEPLQGYVIFAYPEIHKIDTNENKELDNNVVSEKEKVLFKSSFINIESWFKSFNKQYEDTTSLNIERNTELQHNPNDVIQGRTHRWKFAWHLFKNEYNWKNKLFGKGFNYLSWYGEFFHDDPKRNDWPHNPFLSVLLYSGILGLAFYLFVLYKAVYYYVKYIKEYYIFFIFFFITFFFSFFSSNSPFTPPIMGFLLIFPFFLHSVLKNEKLEKNTEKD